MVKIFKLFYYLPLLPLLNFYPQMFSILLKFAFVLHSSLKHDLIHLFLCKFRRVLISIINLQVHSCMVFGGNSCHLAPYQKHLLGLLQLDDACPQQHVNRLAAFVVNKSVAMPMPRLAAICRQQACRNAEANRLAVICRRQA